MPTSKRNNRILAFSPGKRCLGVCVMENGELVLAGVRTFRGNERETKAMDYVAELIRDVDPGFLVLEERSRVGDTFADRVYRGIERLGKELDVNVCVYSTERVKRSVCGNRKATRYEVACAVAECYGEQRRYLFAKGSEKEKYWRPMFGAVAMAMA